MTGPVREPAEEGGFVVTVPALPGCVTQGETRDEAVAMARDCIEGFLACLAESGEPIPVEPEPADAGRSAILLGPQAIDHRDAAALRGLAACLADLTGATLGTLDEGANPAGAWVAGALPYRGPRGAATEPRGLDARAMIENEAGTLCVLRISTRACHALVPGDGLDADGRPASGRQLRGGNQIRFRARHRFRSRRGHLRCRPARVPAGPFHSVRSPAPGTVAAS